VYVGGTIDQVDNCYLDRWSKVEIESICREFGYTTVSRLWIKMPGEISKHANLHQIVDDDAAMFMTDLVNVYEEIHVFVNHLIDEPVEAKVGDIEPLNVRDPSAEHVGPKVDNAQALDVLDPKVIVDDHVGYAGYYEDEVYSDGNESDHYHDHAEYEYDDHYNYDFMIIMMSMYLLMITTDMVF